MYSVLFAGLAVQITRADFKTFFIFLFINPYLFKIYEYMYATCVHGCMCIANAPWNKGGGTGGAGGAIAPPLFTDHFKNYILFDYSDRKLLLTFLTQKQV